MLTLSLLQPWASALFVPAYDGGPAVKSWETRSWAPGEANRSRIQTAGMLIHASKAFKKEQMALMQEFPFADYLATANLYRGAIIGWVKIGEIIPTDQFNARMEKTKGIDNGFGGFTKLQLAEKRFGDYSAGRFAWEITKFVLFDEPTPAKGRLSLWEFEPGNLIGNPLA